MKRSRGIIGQVEFDVVDRLVVADPCYIDEDDIDTSLDGLGVELEGATGTWRATVVSTDEGIWGRRVAKLVANKIGADRAVTHRTVSENGVDSGQMYMGDVANRPLNYDRLLEEYQESGQWVNKDILAAEGGVVSSTGFGDGVYPVKVGFDRDGHPVEIIVDFMEDEEG